MALAELSGYLASLLEKYVLVTIGKLWTRWGGKGGPIGLVGSCANLLCYAIKVPSSIKHYSDVLPSLDEVLEYVC